MRYLPNMTEGWDAVRRVRIGGRPAVRHVLHIKPEHIGQQATSSLGSIRRFDVGRFYVLDKYEDGGDAVDVITDASPLPFDCISTIAGAREGEHFQCTKERDHKGRHKNKHVEWV